MQKFVLSLEFYLVIQNSYEAIADEHRETVSVPDKSSSDTLPSAAMEGYLNYKATHHDGKVVIMLHIQMLHKFYIFVSS